MFTVVLAVDRNEERAVAQATPVAAYPADEELVEAVVLYVFPEVQSDEGGRIDMDDYAGLPDSVERARSVLEEAGIRTRTEERSGQPAEEILAVADEADADQIVVGGRKRSRVGKAIFGSVAQTVILQSDVPVLTVPIDDG